MGGRITSQSVISVSDTVSFELMYQFRVVDVVSVYSQHVAARMKGQVSALGPEGDPVLLHKEGSEWIADLVGIVSVGDVEGHEDQLFSISKATNLEFLKGLLEEHESEYYM